MPQVAVVQQEKEALEKQLASSEESLTQILSQTQRETRGEESLTQILSQTQRETRGEESLTQILSQTQRETRGEELQILSQTQRETRGEESQILSQTQRETRGECMYHRIISMSLFLAATLESELMLNGGLEIDEPDGEIIHS